MVKVAIAGPGQVAREVIDGLVAAGKHDIIILARKFRAHGVDVQDATPERLIKGTTWVKADFQDPKALVQALQGVHTVLSFLSDSAAQIKLIDAAVEAGVKRLAPSEWGPSDLKHLPWYEFKRAARKHLEEKNKDKKVIEYCLFQPGWFMEPLAGSRQTAKHVQTIPLLLVDHNERFAHVAGGLASRVTYTTIGDMVNIVVKAIDYEGEWPILGGINGHTLSIGDEIAIGERIRVETLEREDLLAGNVKTARPPVFNHPFMAGMDAEQVLKASKYLLGGWLLNLADGGATVGDEWNRIFPDYKFTTVEEFLVGVFGNE